MQLNQRVAKTKQYIQSDATRYNFVLTAVLMLKTNIFKT